MIQCCNSFSTGMTALSLIYALQLAVETCQACVQRCTAVENFMTSVERVVSYTQFEPEPGYDTGAQPPDDWPQHGRVEVQHLTLSYHQDSNKVLKDVSFSICPHEKIGIVGRTGAGKTSIVSALFRMPEAEEGRIIIDGVNIADLVLQSSRRAISVIAQDPILFTGTLRMNLDPFGNHSDAELCGILEEAGSFMKSLWTKLNKHLGEEIKECGANFSAGERQLLCLCRALLQKNKIIVLDEATANMDYKTDRLIQETIRSKFQECTVMTIAHRLNTIMDYDRVLVLENGRVVEFDEPQELLRKEGGSFARLCRSHSADRSDT